jgi:predicted O-linked N-acetylglucosamine transferase (SPINDLY family)
MREALETAIGTFKSGRLEEALASVRAIVRTRPKDFESRLLLGFLLHQAGEHGQAMHHLEQVVAARPNDPQPRNNLANVMMAVGRWKDAAAHLRTATESTPSYQPAWNGLCVALLHSGDAMGAIDASSRALRVHALWPDLALSRTNALAMADRLEDAVNELRSACRSFPGNSLIRGNLLLQTNALSLDAEDVALEHRAYARCVTCEADPPARDASPGRQLRLGILSSDLRTHSVAYFVRAVLEHRPAGGAVVAISTAIRNPDEPMTASLRAHCDEWVDAGELDDAALDRRIRELGIDVLVELNGHTGGNRLAALDRKPAPVIVTAIGYPNTTGHPCVDARIVDSTTDPSGTDHRCTERLLRLDPCFLCYSPPAEAPEPSIPDPGSPITFGSFNETKKVRAESVALWAGPLRELPDSRLVIKARSAAEPTVRASLLGRFASVGIDPARIEILPFAADTRSHLALYSRVHVALDPTPYNGTTTTCEALWMGVPVVTLTGDRHASRVGTSLLRAIGMAEWCAATPADFTRIAVGLAGDPGRLGSLRSGLREQVRRSPLTDGPAYGRRFHAAIRACWREWCARSRA